MKKILVILADGFEEIEAITPIDVWRRLGIQVTVAGTDGKTIPGAHGVAFASDTKLSEIDASEYAAVFLPGGMPGSMNLRENPAVLAAVNAVYAGGGLATAICAAPIALAAAGVLSNKTVTAYPGFEDYLSMADYSGAMVETDGRIITGKGPGAAFEFAAAVAGKLGFAAAVENLYQKMFVCATVMPSA